MVNSFFLTLETIYCFFAQPMNHEAFKEVQRSLGVKSKIDMISDTRWACRYKNVASLKKSFLPLLKVLTEPLQPTNRKFIEAACLFDVLKSTRFCICLIIFHYVLRTIHVVHKSLQAGDITLFSAKTCLENMIHVFKTMRTGAKWDEMWKKLRNFKYLLASLFAKASLCYSSSDLCAERITSVHCSLHCCGFVVI